MKKSSDFVRLLGDQIRRAKETEAEKAAQEAAKRNDMVAAAHHAARAGAFHDAYRNPEAQAEVDEETARQVRAALNHPDPSVRESARQALVEQ